MEKAKLYTVSVPVLLGSIPSLIAVFNPVILVIVALSFQTSLKLPLSAVIH